MKPLPFHTKLSGLLMTLSFVFAGCQSTNGDSHKTTATKTTSVQQNIPQFNAGMAYNFIQKQVDFGPRVPGTPAHKKCAAWLEQKLSAHCDTVYKQETTLTAGNGKKLPCINLIGVFNPNAKQRILLLAHWDTRPWADQGLKNKDKPILGADDGGSGTAVLLALSAVLQKNPLPKGWGVDILLTDVEDYGKTKWGDDSYALGTQYWAKHPHVPHYQAQAGILLDMVGGRNARFPMEAYSYQQAPHVLKSVWNAAQAAGYSSFFVYVKGAQIVDDHAPVNKIIHIPTIDIVNLPAGSPTAFADYWHTHRDNMNIISRKTLKAVGQTLLQYLYTR